MCAVVRGICLMTRKALIIHTLDDAEVEVSDSVEDGVNGWYIEVSWLGGIQEIETQPLCLYIIHLPTQLPLPHTNISWWILILKLYNLYFQSFRMKFSMFLTLKINK